MSLGNALFVFVTAPQYRIVRAGLVIGATAITGYGIYRLVRRKK